MVESRRDRLRAATIEEISRTARRILVEEGADAVTLRAIARDMGMTAPALYRYFGSHGDLLRHLVGDLFNELTATITADLHEVPKGDLSGKFMAASRGFRHWAREHRREYELLFGAPLPGLDHEEKMDFAEECARKFGATFLALFVELWKKGPFPVPADDELDPGLREQLRRYREESLGVSLPLGLIQQFLQCWIRLQGAVSLEVFGHLDFALDDPEPMFELMLAATAADLGLEYVPPGGKR
ncbi:TetR/AcrR family transcriptional regulator [Spirillospora sp. CA-294931]|uniref:TetR/AcrR family transcriptional regulator n=1 Tax=Spirillospora sp. CA-294931 TaxID=3240042 RepID=UPI003D8D9C98